MKKNRRLSILGGGPAGLAVAYYAKKAEMDFLLYEATERVGGNCKTITYKDFKFDTGAHRLHGKNDLIVEEVKNLLNGDLQLVDKPSFIFHEGKYINFPISPYELFKKLTPLMGLKAVHSFLRKNRIKAPTSFKETAEAKYGSVISDLFLNNYSEKLWGLPTESLSPRISGNRLKYLNLRTILRDLVRSNGTSQHMEGKFYYLVNGFGQIVEHMADYIGRDKILLKNRVSVLHHDRNRIKQVEMGDGTKIEVDLLVSSLPLPLTIKMLNPSPPKQVLELSNKFSFRHLTLVCFMLKKEQVNGGATIYFPSTEFEFTRGYEPKNRSTKMAPKGMTSFIIEVPSDEVDVKDRTRLLDKITSQLTHYGLFEKSEIIDTTFHTVPYAYPVLKKGIENDIEELINYLSSFENLYLTGRNGLFEYSWTHNMLSAGKEIIDELCNEV